MSSILLEKTIQTDITVAGDLNAGLWTVTFGRNECAEILWKEECEKNIEEGECWRIITNEEIKDILQEKGAVKFIKSP